MRLSTVLALLLASTSFVSVNGQSLQPGDIALVGIYSDTPDAFAFVALRQLPAGTLITFTDNGWQSSGGFRANEQEVSWTAASAVAAGTVVTLECVDPNMTATTGTTNGALCGLSTGGDQILAYQGSADSPVFIYAVNIEGNGWQATATSSNTSALPPGLVNGETAVALPELDNYAFTGPTSGTAVEMRAAIGQPANWTGNDDRALMPAPPAQFTLTGSGGGSPAVSFTVASVTHAENEGLLALTVILTDTLATTETVEVFFAGGTATEQADFTFSPATLTFGPTITSATIQFAAVDDSDVEGDETVTLHLQNPSGTLTLGVPAQVTITLKDDDAPASSVLSIADARAAGQGTAVTVRGVITRALGDFTRIKDDAAALTIRQSTGPFNVDLASGELAQGDSIEVTGLLSDYNGLLQINDADLTGYTRLSRGHALPPAQIVTVAQVLAGGEAFESELIRIENLTTTASGSFVERQSYDVNDSTGTIELRTPNAADSEIDGELIPSGTFVYEGVLSQFSMSGVGGYQLLPVDRRDVIATTQSGPTRLSFVTGAAVISEEAGSYTIEVAISGPSAAEPTLVDVVLTGGTATNGADIPFYTTQTLTFPAASTARQRITLTITQDGVDEGEETFVFALQNPRGGQNASLTPPTSLTLTLRDTGVGYVTLFPGVTGTALLDSLRRVYTPTTLGYTEARRQMFGYVWNDSGRVAGIYTGLRIPVTPGAGDATAQATTGGFNTEHGFPQSMGAGDEPRRSNLYNLFPSVISVNSDRGSLPFGEVADAQATDWYRLTTRQSIVPAANLDEWSERGQGLFEPREAVKGDIARSQFYFYALYAANSNPGFFGTMRDDLYLWHRQDGVTVDERIRHDRIAQVQGKDNPFVLDSSLVRRAYFPADTGGPSEAPITLAQARAQGTGATVLVRGVVTRAMGAYAYLQDDTGGLAVHQPSGAFFADVASGAVAPGDSIELRGTLSLSDNLLQISSTGLDRYAVLSSNHALPAPIALSVADVFEQGERYESVLIKVEGVEFGEAGVFTEQTTYPARAGAASIDVYIGSSADTELDGLPVPAVATFTGVLTQASAPNPVLGYRLTPVLAGDLTLAEIIRAEVTDAAAFVLHGAYPNPASSIVTLRFEAPSAASVEVIIYDAMGRQVLVLHAPDGSNGTLTLDTAALSTGLYLYRLTALQPTGIESASGKLTIIR